jgi:hypothetical protein
MDLDQIKYWLIQDRFWEMFQLPNAFDTNAIDQTKM